MAKFTVEYPNKHSADVAFSKVKDLLTKGDDLKKYDPSLLCKFNDQKMTCQIKGGKVFSRALRDFSRGSESRLNCGGFATAIIAI
jgi:hypothetical protein